MKSEEQKSEMLPARLARKREALSPIQISKESDAPFFLTVFFCTQPHFNLASIYHNITMLYGT